MQSQSQQQPTGMEAEQHQVLVRPAAMSIFDAPLDPPGQMEPVKPSFASGPMTTGRELMGTGATIAVPDYVFMELISSLERVTTAARQQPVNPRHDPLAIGLIGAGVLGLLICGMFSLVRASQMSPTAQQQAQQQAMERMAARSQKLAEEAIKKPRCSFTLVCPGN